MAQHATDPNLTQMFPASECLATTVMLPIAVPRWFHVCGKEPGHSDVHECGECGTWWL